MTNEERKRMYELCSMIEKESDPERFMELVKELNNLLEEREQTLITQSKQL
jgi:hypothetical protein